VNDEDLEAFKKAGIVVPEAKVLEIKLPFDLPAQKIKSKYNNTKTIYNGEKYDSVAEAERAKFLDSLYEAGLRKLRQPRFKLGVPENVYVADFFVTRPGLPSHVEDVKGMKTAKFMRDVKLWKAYGEWDLWIVTGAKVEVIEGGRKAR
jgi:hypothetical protein